MAKQQSIAKQDNVGNENIEYYWTTLEIIEKHGNGKNKIFSFYQQ